MAEPYTIGPVPPSGSLDLNRPLQASDTAVVVQMGEITTTLQGGSSHRGVTRCDNIFLFEEGGHHDTQKFLNWALDGLHEDLNKAEKKLNRNVCVATVNPGRFADGYGSHWLTGISHTSQHLLLWKSLWSAVLKDVGMKVWLPFLAPGDVMPICCSIVVPMPMSGGLHNAWLTIFSISV